MRILASALVYVSLSTCVLIACGGSDSADGPSVSEFVAMLPDQLCSQVESCLGGNEVLAKAADIEGCADRVKAQLDDGSFSHLQDAIDAGRVKYDATAVDACIDALNMIGCELQTTRLQVGDCGKVFTGTVDVGEACNLSEECMGQSFCDNQSMCPGMCKPLLSAGEDCVDDDQCKDGLACSDTSGVCATLAKESETCGGSVGADCVLPFSCMGADDQTGAAGTCLAADDVFVGKEGETCDLNTGVLCKSGLSCIVMINGTNVTSECHALYESGGACNFGAPSSCPDGEYCNANINAGQVEGTCTPLPKAGEGCADSDCAADLICDTDQRCHPINRLGQPCVSDAGCSSDHCEGGVCVEPDYCES